MSTGAPPPNNPYGAGSSSFGAGSSIFNTERTGDGEAGGTQVAERSAAAAQASIFAAAAANESGGGGGGILATRATSTLSAGSSADQTASTLATIRGATQAGVSATIAAAANMQVGELSNQMVRAHIDEGAFSVEESRRRLERSDQMLAASLTRSLASRDEIDVEIQDFGEKVGSVINDLHTYARLISKKIINDDEVGVRHEQRFQFLLVIAQGVRGEFEKNVRLLMEFREANSDHTLDSMTSHIALLFRSRMDELGLITAQVKLVQEHEDHELEQQIRVMDQFMRAESQAFDQTLQAARLEQEIIQAERDNNLALLEQKRKERRDLMEMVNAAVEVEGNQLIERQRLEVDAANAAGDREIRGREIDGMIDVARRKVDADRQVEQGRISAIERTEERRISATERTEGKKIGMQHDLGKRKIASHERVAHHQIAANLVASMKPRCSVM